MHLIEKKSQSVTVKLTDSQAHFSAARAKQLGMESDSEYLRSLVEADRIRALNDFNLLGDALGIKVNTVNPVNQVNGDGGVV